MKFSFMSFSCPEADIKEFIGIAKQYGYDGIEPRLGSGHKHGIEPGASDEFLQDVLDTIPDMITKPPDIMDIAEETIPIAIRLAVPADAPDMAEVHMRSWEAAYKDIIPEEYIREKNATRPEMWQKKLAEGQYPHRVIQINGKTVGNMCVAPPQDDDLDETYYELHGIYLHPDYFRQGIGTQAMEFALDIARSIGKKHMTVWVLAENINSIKFYEKCGFIADGKTKILNFGKPIAAIRMRRKI
jgi:GNAT superfamily N-acetyltransferase